MPLLLKQIIIATLTFAILDFLWLGIIATSMYQAELKAFVTIENGSMMINWYSGVLVYALLVMGVIIFPVSIAHGNTMSALLYGTIFGLIVYGVYDFTNYAIVTNWPLKASIIDMIWGGVICGLSSMSVTYFSR